MVSYSLSARRSSPAGGNGVHRPAPSLKHVDATFSLDADDGAFEGYASLFGVMDLGHDVVIPGAFRDSLARRGVEGVKLLWQHDPAEPLGVWTSIAEDRRGLHVRGRLNLERERSREALSLMRQGALDGLSIGYRTEIERKDPETGLRRLERIDLWEISLVTFPLLPQARVHAVAPALVKGSAFASFGR